MRKLEISLYKIHELDKKVQDKVISKFRDENDYPLLTEKLKDELRTLLDFNHIEIIDKLNINYRLDHSQGDGAMFEGIFKWDKYNVTIIHSGHYSHYNSKEIYLNFINDDFETEEECDKATEQMQHDTKAFNTTYVSICKQLDKFGYNEIEYQDSEEAIRKMIEINNYEFLEDGTIFNTVSKD